MGFSRDLESIAQLCTLIPVTTYIGLKVKRVIFPLSKYLKNVFGSIIVLDKIVYFISYTFIFYLNVASFSKYYICVSCQTSSFLCSFCLEFILFKMFLF